jgi:hypothetical protein
MQGLVCHASIAVLITQCGNAMLQTQCGRKYGSVECRVLTTALLSIGLQVDQVVLDSSKTGAVVTKKKESEEKNDLIS